MFLISIPALKRNATILRDVRDAAECRLVLALKGYSCWKSFPHIRDMLDGCCASGLWEATLAQRHFGKHIITYSPAYDEAEVDALCEFTHHLDFNSPGQWLRFRDRVTRHPRFLNGELQCGLRINPEHSTGETPIYDPCVPGSRLGATAAQLDGLDLTGISGLHFHTLCEQNSDALESTLDAVDAKFGALLASPQIRYLNMGGGHWITKPDYDRQRLIRLVRQTAAKYNVEVWLEPGEAVAIHTGVLRATVMDVFESAGHHLAILDVSATAHMPDVLEMPYRPDVFLVEKRNADFCPPEHPIAALRQTTEPIDITRCGEVVATLNPQTPAVTLEGESYLPTSDPAHSKLSIQNSEFVFRLGGPTCLAGDVIGDYAFPRPLVPGDTLVFDDMAHYTMVKTTMFNGVKHPPIALLHENGRIETIREFSYDDFENRLG